MLRNVMTEVYRVLSPGGRACVNVANLGRKPYIPLNSYITNFMIEIGFLMRGEIIWNKSSSAGTSTAWGSWQSASNPTLRDVHEYIMVFSKGSFGRLKSKEKDAEKRENTISKEEFLEYTKSIWDFPTESARRIGHPAPFPMELPRRLIQLYTFKNDVVLDPFMGSGQTAIASVKSDRYFIGYDVKEEYVELALERLKTYSPTQR
jgi:site-specific DNA-methyltransferase (adenine-specific)